ncbi:MAG TPA: cytochrome c [Pirellulales bacterium]|nr:cytochrome c [Pirellulales bacterium]
MDSRMTIAARSDRRLATCALLALGAMAIAGGCSTQVDPPQFRMNMQDILQEAVESHSPDEFRVVGNEEESDKEDKLANIAKLETLTTLTVAAFGEPNEPYLLPEVRWNAEEKKGLDFKKITMAAGPTGGDDAKKQLGLFRQHCVHCHGVTGDGAGPTAAFLNPHPRDYRRGTFKFKSTGFNDKPTTADLKRTLIDGIPGTAMPSFALLPADQIEALVEYVKYLSIRGETERNMAGALFLQDEEIEATRAGILEGYLQPIVDQWAAAEEAVVRPTERPETSTPEELASSIEEGRKLFFNKDAQCTKCHGPTGLGDGNDGMAEKLYDVWNEKKTADDLARWLLPKQELRPRNLRMGIYRGGGRPLDIYRRIHAGIPGTPMPGAGPQPGKKETFTPEQIWHLVDYVRSLPYENASEPAEGQTHVAAAHSLSN